jgi:hypothetical protein
MNIYVGFVLSGASLMSEIIADPPSPSCYHLYPGDGIQENQRPNPDPFLLRARDARGRFAKGSSGNPRGRPPGIRNPRRRVNDLVARPLTAQALSDLLDRRRICCGRSQRNSCRRLLPSTRRSVSGSTWRRCGRSRIAGGCWPLFRTPLRVVRSRPSTAGASQSE